MTAPGLEKPRVGIILFFHGEMNIFFPRMVFWQKKAKPMFLFIFIFYVLERDCACNEVARTRDGPVKEDE